MDDLFSESLREDLSHRICRIKLMEQYYDHLSCLWHRNCLDLTDETQRYMLSQLIRYYDSPLWLADYESDERGELPTDLKRGVLSQDGVYHLLTGIFPGGNSNRIYEEAINDIE